VDDRIRAIAWRNAARLLEWAVNEEMRDESSCYRDEALAHIRDTIAPMLRKRAEMIERRKRRG